MAADQASLTEEDIRQRVNLEYQNLADVRSLSLPGTYHEKIVHLGKSLKNFVRLKSLDLSRNALTTLEGLQHLTYLEKLNLYFNRISALSEVFRLHALTALKDLDLRLNPVVKNESDYRLFVVHMLPNLRRLDDRPVRDCERKASLLHFTTDHAYELKKCAFVPKVAEPGSCVHPRVAYINSMSKKCVLMDEDDEAVLNLITKNEWDLCNSPRITGSAQRDSAVEFHNLNCISKMQDTTSRCKNIATQSASFQKWKQENLSKVSPSACRYMLTVPDKEYGSLPKSPTPLTVHHGFGKKQEKRKNNGNFKFLEDESQELSKRDPNLMFHDEFEAYEKIMTHANFTPHPEMNEPFISSEKAPRYNQKESKPEPEEQVHKSKGPQEANQVAGEALYEATPLEQLLDLVDKYWNGCKSLHCNRKFLSQAETILCAIQESMPTEQKKASTSNPELQNLLLEKKSLQKRLSTQEKQFTVKIKNLESELNCTKKHMDAFKQHLDQVLEENTMLKACASTREPIDQNADLAQLQIFELQNLNKMLSTENASLKEHLQHFDKMQELTAMLQESHRTLVSTNQRLFQELEETRARQKAEVEQLHWNYDQLKKTMNTHPHSDRESSRS